MKEKTGSLGRALALLALGMSGGSIYIIPYIRYVFYEQQLAVMNINNAQAGFLITLYAIIAIILLAPGGFMADKYSPKKLIIYALLGTTILTVLYAVTLDYKIALAVWVGFGFSCAFVFWPALMKAIGSLGAEAEQGRNYGIYYAINGISAAAINGISLWVSTLSDDPTAGYRMAMFFVAGGTFIALILIILFFKDPGTIAGSADDKIKLKDIPAVVKNPFTWALAFATFAAYIVYSSNTYFNGYLVDVRGVEPSTSGAFTIIRTYVFMLMAPVAGYISDKLLRSTAKLFMIAFSLILLLIIGIMVMPAGTSPTFSAIYTLFPAAITMGVYGVQFSILRELDIPVEVTGTAIGVSSFFSWTADLFMHTMYGSWIDKYAGTGYTYIFLFTGSCALVAILVGFFVYRAAKKRGYDYSKPMSG